ncbi:MAG: hypothetical protein A3J58_02530 [Candidatus Sungbacteria bacterium RIFCSPHIGHO2_02_FULL_52_23]|uniref:Phosphoribosylformylglycinamidine cyclo-ligase n=1 Tax=Candidatus Sungbacteria bacterium RIFCSPHIGHO2_02_FULL_52_23 TaxID=1802274 RepID=A0A1G2L078_9BACT|nr:MAG: hypothetical protein A3J58_02530 [Candidatus Sungbacteria bacterium RIFCSPHIGHO2_02_FULL_52_23]
MEISRYEQRGVSASKPDVEQAVTVLDPGLYPGAFCRIYPDYFCGSPDHCVIQHSDGAGSKALLAYLYWKLTDDLDWMIWSGIVKDSLFMNLDDAACAGAFGPFIVSMAIARNKRLIPGDIVKSLIGACQKLCSALSDLGFPCHFTGGETADLGDQVRTLTVDHTITVRFLRSDVIDASRISAPALIVGFSSTGRAAWEDKKNSGIRSNGLTNARHDILSPAHRIHTETFDPESDPDLVYCGNYGIWDTWNTAAGTPDFYIGSALLSPTRTYLPLISNIVREIGVHHIQGFIHCSGGGQTKIGKFGFPGIVYLKDDLLPVPPIFQMLHVPGMSLRQMYETYNMGHGLEAVVKDQVVADVCIEIAALCGIEAKVIGRVVPNGANPHGRKVVIKTAGEEFSYGV